MKTNQVTLILHGGIVNTDQHLGNPIKNCTMKLLLAFILLIFMSGDINGQISDSCIVWRRNNIGYEYQIKIKADSIFSQWGSKAEGKLFFPFVRNIFLLKNESIYLSSPNGREYEIFNYQKFLNGDTMSCITKWNHYFEDQVRITLYYLLPDTIFNLDSEFPIFRYKLCELNTVVDGKSIPENLLRYDKGFEWNQKCFYNPVLGFIGGHSGIWLDDLPKHVVEGNTNFRERAKQMRKQLGY